MRHLERPSGLVGANWGSLGPIRAYSTANEAQPVDSATGWTFVGKDDGEKRNRGLNGDEQFMWFVSYRLISKCVGESVPLRGPCILMAELLAGCFNADSCGNYQFRLLVTLKADSW